MWITKDVPGNASLKWLQIEAVPKNSCIILNQSPQPLQGPDISLGSVPAPSVKRLPVLASPLQVSRQMGWNSSSATWRRSAGTTLQPAMAGKTTSSMSPGGPSVDSVYPGLVGFGSCASFVHLWGLCLGVG